VNRRSAGEGICDGLGPLLIHGVVPPSGRSDAPWAANFRECRRTWKLATLTIT
jgi:hypothetical protein